MKNTSPSSLLTSARFLQWGIIQCGLTLLAAGSVLADSEVIYRNNFGSNTGVNTSYLAPNNANIGWKLLRSENGGNVADRSSTGDARSGIWYAVGRPSNLSNVNAPVSLSDEYGIAFLSNASSGSGLTYEGLFFTDHYVVDRSNFEVDSFQWYANGSDTLTTQRLALQVSGNWYVTDTVAPPMGSFGTFSTTNSSLYTIDINTSSWYSLTANIGSPFSIGETSVSLPDADITAFGLFVDPGSAGNAYTRFDTFTINATAIPVPEPGSALLFGSGLLGMLFWNSRRRKG